MERVEVYVPPPVAQGIEEYQDSHGFENRSQATRNLLRQALECENA